MLHLVTRAKNANQHPGLILSEGKQIRRTSEQKQANDAQAKQVRQEQVATQEQGIKHLARIISKAEKGEEDLLTRHPRPQPQ
ncbi:hypothetical protein PAXRUDRAFT_76887, partial [Paxillus rubicundulus Ve08.2h10]